MFQEYLSDMIWQNSTHLYYLFFPGTYKWVEKKGTSQCNVDLQFKTNKFDSNITGYITLIDQTISSNMHIRYKFEKVKNESLNFELNYKDRSTKLITALTGNFKLESTAYPDMNMALDLKYQVSDKKRYVSD